MRARTLSCDAGLCRAIEDRFQEESVAAADVETGIAAVAEVARQLVAGQADQVEDADGAALDQLFRARIDGAALEQHVALRHDQLDGDLALDVDVLQHRGTGGADVDERRGQRSALDRRRRHRQRRFEDDVVRSGAESRIAEQRHLPRQRQPQRRLFVLRDRLRLDVGDAGLAKLIDGPLHGLVARREAGDAAPHLAAADLLVRRRGPRETDDGLDVGLEGGAGELRSRGIGCGGARRARADLDGG